MENLVKSMSLGKKSQMFFDYLKAGNTLEIDGGTYLWLDNHVTRTTIDSEGKEQTWGIDGLALRFNKTDAKDRHIGYYYIGQNDMTISNFIYILNNLTEEQLVGMAAYATLIPKKSRSPKKTRRN